MKQLNGRFATDTIWAKSLSLRGNVASQIFSHKCGFNTYYPISRENNEQAGFSLNDLASEYGGPEYLTYDGADVQVGKHTNFQKSIRKYEIKTHVSAPRRPNENLVEGAIREIKKQWYRMQKKLHVTDLLWDYDIAYVCETGNLAVNS